MNCKRLKTSNFGSISSRQCIWECHKAKLSAPQAILLVNSNVEMDLPRGQMTLHLIFESIQQYKYWDFYFQSKLYVTNTLSYYANVDRVQQIYYKSKFWGNQDRVWCLVISQLLPQRVNWTKSSLEDSARLIDFDLSDTESGNVILERCNLALLMHNYDLDEY